MNKLRQLIEEDFDGALTLATKSTDELQDKVEIPKNILIARATGRPGDLTDPLEESPASELEKSGEILL